MPSVLSHLSGPRRTCSVASPLDVDVHDAGTLRNTNPYLDDKALLLRPKQHETLLLVETHFPQMGLGIAGHLFWTIRTTPIAAVAAPGSSSPVFVQRIPGVTLIRNVPQPSAAIMPGIGTTHRTIRSRDFPSF